MCSPNRGGCRTGTRSFWGQKNTPIQKEASHVHPDGGSDLNSSTKVHSLPLVWIGLLLHTVVGYGVHKDTFFFSPFSVGHVVSLKFFDAYYIVAVTCVRLNMCR